MPSRRPTIYLIGGCNGAGKTTFAKEFLPSIGVIRFLNADEIARGLSPLKPEAVAFKAGRLLLNELRELIDRHETFALESTLSGRTYTNDHLLKDYAPLANKWFLWDNSMPPAKLLAESATHTIIDLRSVFSFHEEKSV